MYRTHFPSFTGIRHPLKDAVVSCSDNSSTLFHLIRLFLFSLEAHWLSIARRNDLNTNWTRSDGWIRDPLFVQARSKSFKIESGVDVQTHIKEREIVGGQVKNKKKKYCQPEEKKTATG